ESFDVELRPQRRFGAVPQLHDLEHPNLVPGGLPGERYVSPDLRARLVGRKTSRVDHVINGLLLGPTQSMNAGVDDEAGGSKMFLVEMHEVGREIRIGPHLLAKLLRIK